MLKNHSTTPVSFTITSFNKDEEILEREKEKTIELILDKFSLLSNPNPLPDWSYKVSNSTVKNVTELNPVMTQKTFIPRST